MTLTWRPTTIVLWILMSLNNYEYHYVTQYDAVDGWVIRLCKKPAWGRKFPPLEPPGVGQYNYCALILWELQNSVCDCDMYYVLAIQNQQTLWAVCYKNDGMIGMRPCVAVFPNDHLTIWKWIKIWQVWMKITDSWYSQHHMPRQHNVCIYRGIILNPEIKTNRLLTDVIGNNSRTSAS